MLGATFDWSFPRRPQHGLASIVPVLIGEANGDVFTHEMLVMSRFQKPIEAGLYLGSQRLESPPFNPAGDCGG